MQNPHSSHIPKFKARAKKLLRAVRAGDTDALHEIKPYFDSPSSFKLTQAQLVVARSLGCESWRQLIHRDDWVACSFCKKWQYELKKLIAGPDAYVCNECVEFCNDILKDTAEPAREVQ